MQVDNLNVGATLNGGGVSTFIADISNAQEVVTTNSGGLGEAEVGGPTINIVPKTGGNSLKGSAYLSGVPSRWVGSNYSDALKSAGLSTPGALIKQWDFDAGLGGPIKKDKLWFFITARDEGQYRSIPGIYPNLNAGDPTKFLYVADTTRQAQGAESWQVGTVRLTWQASQRNKLNFFWDEQLPCNGSVYDSTIEGCRQQPSSGAFIGAIGLGGLTTTTSPETSGYLRTLGDRVQQVTWTSPMTNRLLFEAGFGTQLARWGPMEMPGNPTRDLARVTEQCAAGCAANGGIAGLNYRSANWANHWAGVYTWRASASYVTGSHSLKFGDMGGYLQDDEKNFGNNLNLTLRLNNGVPNGVTESALPFAIHRVVRYDALYAQEQWTHGRLTLQGALRFDHAWSYFPEQIVEPTNYLPFRIVYPRSDGILGYKDLTPRMGMAYDVFGNGKTSLKVNLGKYLEPASNGNGNYSVTNPTARLVTSSGLRTWTDANGNFSPTAICSARARRTTARPAATFAARATRTSESRSLPPTTTRRFSVDGVRPTDWGLGVSVQQQLLASIRRSRLHPALAPIFTVTDNLLVAPSDTAVQRHGPLGSASAWWRRPSRACSTSPESVRTTEQPGHLCELPSRIAAPVPALQRITLELLGPTQQWADSKRRDQHRQDRHRQLRRSRSASRNRRAQPYCHSRPGFITRVTGIGTYVIPKVDVNVSGTFRSDQGAVLAANWAVPSATAALSLGRPLSGNATNATVNLITPGDVWGDRVNEVDVHIGKILRFGRTRTNVGIDIYNVINSAAILTYNQAFVPGGTWLAPTSVLTPRFVKFGAQIDF